MACVARNERPIQSQKQATSLAVFIYEARSIMLLLSCPDPELAVAAEATSCSTGTKLLIYCLELELINLYCLLPLEGPAVSNLKF